LLNCFGDFARLMRPFLCPIKRRAVPTLHKRVEHFVAGFRRFRFDLCLRKTETGRLSQ
jgi:hypothetical protein